VHLVYPQAGRRYGTVTDTESQDITTQILIQIRDEMRAMRDSFERRFDILETRAASLERRLDSFEAGMGDLEGRIGTIDDRNEQHFQELCARFGALDTDLRKFASITQRAILHYADEMDKVRDRLGYIEDKLQIPQLP
jgi:hypothetical protein